MLRFPLPPSDLGTTWSREANSGARGISQYVHFRVPLRQRGVSSRLTQAALLLKQPFESKHLGNRDNGNFTIKHPTQYLCLIPDVRDDG